MPPLPQGTNANILGNFADRLVNWMDGAPIPARGPHTDRPEQYGCIILQDYTHNNCRAVIKKGMTGSCIGEAKDGKVKIFIRGITESIQKGIWVENCWVPQEIVQKGKPWKADMSDWRFKMSLKGTKLGDQVSISNSADTSTLGETITGLLNEFVQNPAPFMGEKIQDLLDKRGSLQKGSTIDSLVATIIRGIKDAGLYDTLNKPDFTDDDIDLNANYRIDEDFNTEMSGVYVRFHTSTSHVQRWAKNTKFIYVGKSVDFKSRWSYHPRSTSSYGDLTRNSSLTMLALCIMSEEDAVDFAYLVEQVFVCLFQSYRKDICVNLTIEIDASRGIEHVEAIGAANYFNNVSMKVFNTTKFPGAVQRNSFNVAHGANYSMPFKEWAMLLEKALYLRHDTFVKDRLSGTSIPITVFRRARPKIARYAHCGPRRTALKVIQKWHTTGSKKAMFFNASYTCMQKIPDGTLGPRQGDPYQVVIEVRTDGGPHPHGWSRTCDIGAFLNWSQGRALAVRIEWEHPPKSGQWRHRYLSARNQYKYQDASNPGSQVNYIKTIGMIRWLFDARENKFSPWIPRLRGCAYVLQTTYNYHTRTVDIGPQMPFTMRSGASATKNSIAQSMRNLGLENVDGTFGQKARCDTCAMLKQRDLNNMGCECVQVPGMNCCRTCVLMGRPFCSWTKNGAVKGGRAFTPAMIAGTIKNTFGKITSDDVALHMKYRAGLLYQPANDEEVPGKTFAQNPIDISNIPAQEDDLSDVEDEVDAIEDGDDDDDDDDNNDDDDDDE